LLLYRTYTAVAIQSQFYAAAACMYASMRDGSKWTGKKIVGGPGPVVCVRERGGGRGGRRKKENKSVSARVRKIWTDVKKTRFRLYVIYYNVLFIIACAYYIFYCIPIIAPTPMCLLYNGDRKHTAETRPQLCRGQLQFYRIGERHV